MEKINKEILALAVPSIVSNITVPLLGLVDVAIVGHIGDARYIGAIAIGSMVFNMVYWVFAFLRMGTSGMTAQAFGRKDEAEAWRILMRAWGVGWGVAFFFLVFQKPLGVMALWLMNTPDDVRHLVETYFSIVIWGAPAMLGLYGLNGWFVGMQNTRVPMVVAIMQNVVNILLSFLFVFYLHMQIEGVAWGTLLAQWSGFMVAAWCACRQWRRREGRFRFQELLRFAVTDHVALVQFFAVNRDIFFRTLFLVAVNVFFTSAGARQGAQLLAVNTLLMTFFMLYSYVQDGFAYAGEALTGRYYGARDTRSFHRTVQLLFFWGGLFALLFCAAYVLSGKALLGLLTSDRQTVEASLGYLWWTYLIPFAGLAAFVFDGIFIGVTETRGMLLSSLVAAVLFFAVFFLCFGTMGNHALWLAFIVFLTMRGAIQSVIYRRKFV